MPTLFTLFNSVKTGSIAACSTEDELCCLLYLHAVQLGLTSYRQRATHTHTLKPGIALKSALKLANMELVLSERKRDKLADNGYLYIMDKRSRTDPNIRYWRCERYRKHFKCQCRVHTKDGRIVKRLGEHSHEPNYHRVEALKAVQEIKGKALIMPPQGTRELIEEAQANMSPEAAAFLPSTAALCRALQRERQKAELRAGSPPLPVRARRLVTEGEDKRIGEPEAEESESESGQSEEEYQTEERDQTEDSKVNVGTEEIVETEEIEEENRPEVQVGLQRLH